MDGIIRLFKEVDGQTLFIAAIFVCVVFGILMDGIVRIVKNRNNKPSK